MWGHSTPCCANLKAGELGVSWYGRRGLVLLTLGPASHPVSPSPTHPSPSASTLFLGTHKWVGYRPMGLAFDGG